MTTTFNENMDGAAMLFFHPSASPGVFACLVFWVLGPAELAQAKKEPGRRTWRNSIGQTLSVSSPIERSIDRRDSLVQPAIYRSQASFQL